MPRSKAIGNLASRPSIPHYYRCYICQIHFEALGSELWSIQVSRANCKISAPSPISLVLEQPDSTQLSFLDNKSGKGFRQDALPYGRFLDDLS